MSDSTATRSPARARPLSPHLTVYKFTPTMAMSIVHRVTGVALYFGTLLVAWWLVAAAMGPESFALANRLLGSWFGLLVLFGYTWTLIHHMLGGVRHLIWDTGTGLEKHAATRLAWANLIGSVALTLLIWIVAVAVRG